MRFINTALYIIFISNLSGQNKIDLKDPSLSIYDFKINITEKYYPLEQALSIAGAYEESVKYDENTIGSCKYILDSTIRIIEKNIVKSDALNFISKKGMNNKVIIINEAHNKPHHRTFISKILKELQGEYKYYFSEGLIDLNDQLYNLKFPKFSKKFPLTNESNYGNLLRTAIFYRYKIKMYESTNTKCYTIVYQSGTLRIKNNCDANIKEIKISLTQEEYDQLIQRELIQAVNIYNVIKRDSNAKAIIHCGYGHSSRNNNMMGFYLNKLGIQFISFNQTAFNESYKCNSYLKEYEEGLNDDNPFIISNKLEGNGKIFNKPIQGDEDFFIFHPKTKYLGGRPNWMQSYLTDTTWNQHQFLDYKNAPFKILVYRQEEFDILGFNSLPFDIFEINGKSDIKRLILEKGRDYYVFIRDKNFNITKMNWGNRNKIRK